MEIIKIPLEQLTPDPHNAKDHPQWQIEQIKNSIEQFGNLDPIGVWGDDNLIVEGHGRYEALKDLGYHEAECIRLDWLTEEERKAYALAHNKLTMNSGFIPDALDMTLAAIGEIDMSQFGFEIPEEVEPTEITEDEIPEEVETRCKLGDIWQLGEHRLICGDSTNKENIKRLMDGRKAKILFTSPPYSDKRDYNGNKDLSVENISNFIPAYREYTDYQCVNLGIQRKNHEIVQYWDEYILKAKQAGYELLAWNVWDKCECGSVGQQSAFIPIRHEWIFVFGTDFYEINKTWEKKADNIIDGERPHTVRQKDGSTKHASHGDMSNPYKQMESVLALHPEKSKLRELHPATFPVGLPAEYIKAMTDENDNVIEPFGGSGTTLIACEQLDRICFVCELDPHYCDVIIQRWENLTGGKAVRINDAG